jgi:lipopolysaccharide export system permease protein
VKIVARYILREHAGPLLFALSALTSLLLLNFVAKKFGDLVGKGLPWTVIAEFLLLSIPFTLAMTLPMAVLVATLHAFSRFAAENEITAFKASGVSMQRLVRPVILASVFLTFFMIWFNDQVLPRANHRLATLQSDIARVKPTLALQEQVINEVVPRQLFLRAGRIASGSNQMKDVTIYDLGDPTRRRTIVADSGVLAFNATGEDLILTLYDGSMVELTGTEPDQLQRSFYKTDMIKVRGVAVRLDRNEDRRSYRSDRELTVCELQARVSNAASQRDSAYVRLARAKDSTGTAEPARPPRDVGGAGGLYCSALGLVAKLTGRAVVEPELLEPAASSGLSASAQAQLAVMQTPRPPKPTTNQAAAGSPDSRSAPDSEVVNAAPQRRQVSEVELMGMQLELDVAQNTIDQFRVEIEKKFAIATACIVFVLLGAPIALRFPRGGVGLTIGVSLAVFGVYYVGLLGGEALADRALVGPSIAMWAANALLGIVGVILTLRLGSEGSTSRGSETSEWWGRIMERFRRRKTA